MNRALWIVQILLVVLFLFTGSIKLVLPVEELTRQIPLPGASVRLIGVLEVLGAIGLIVPALTRIRPGLTALAAACLAVLMLGAIAISLSIGAQVAIPLAAFGLSAFVGYGRWRVAPVKAIRRASYGPR